MGDSSSNTGKEKGENVESSTRGGLTRRLWGYLLSRSGLSPENRWEKASKTDITKLVQELLHGRYSVTGRGLYRDEFVTCGGVPLKEVSFDTFESKIVPGMHLCGEVLDIDGVTGGKYTNNYKYCTILHPIAPLFYRYCNPYAHFLSFLSCASHSLLTYHTVIITSVGYNFQSAWTGGWTAGNSAGNALLVSSSAKLPIVKQMIR